MLTQAAVQLSGPGGRHFGPVYTGVCLDWMKALHGRSRQLMYDEPVAARTLSPECPSLCLRLLGPMGRRCGR